MSSRELNVPDRFVLDGECQCSNSENYMPVPSFHIPPKAMPHVHYRLLPKDSQSRDTSFPRGVSPETQGLSLCLMYFYFSMKKASSRTYSGQVWAVVLLNRFPSSPSLAEAWLVTGSASCLSSFALSSLEISSWISLQCDIRKVIQ